MKKSIAALFAASISAQQQFLQEYMVDHLLCVSAPSVTPRVQEAHILIAYGICELVEQRLFGAESSG